MSEVTERKDYMTVKIERASDADPRNDPKVITQAEAELRKALLVSGTVELVEYNTLLRTDRKSKRVFDNRE